jgi:hypothetical protein
VTATGAPAPGREEDGRWPSVIRRWITGNRQQPIVFDWAVKLDPEVMPAVVFDVFGEEGDWYYYSGCDDDCPEYLQPQPCGEAGAADALWHRGAPFTNQ